MNFIFWVGRHKPLKLYNQLHLTLKTSNSGNSFSDKSGKQRSKFIRNMSHDKRNVFHKADKLNLPNDIYSSNSDAHFIGMR